MHRNLFTYRLQNLEDFRQKLYAYSRRFGICSLLDSNNIPVAKGHKRYELLAGLGFTEILSCRAGNAFQQLHDFHSSVNDWLFGSMSYALQKETEPVLEPFSKEQPGKWPDLFFFQPETVVAVTAAGNDWQLEISSFKNPETIFSEILGLDTEINPVEPASFSAATTKTHYKETVERIREDIIRGDYYEINYCQCFIADAPVFDATSSFLKLSERSPAPFSALMRFPGKSLVCASPERFLMKQGNTLISQPIKGTRRRGKTEEEDVVLAEQLQNSEKERAENVMIVDLVRNDLSHSCKAGTVKVEELFGIYKFAHVFQMISTVTGELDEDMNFTEAIGKAFPMGSMTGAPKVEVMKHIAEYEDRPRGIYSGSVGYISPGGDFDFNVVIRSLVYDEVSQELSYHVGGAIVYDSIAGEEYEECMVKAAAVLSIFN